MTFKTFLLGAAIALLPALASAHVEITNAVARVTSPVAQSAAVYFTIRNHSDDTDRMFRVEGDVAARVEIHTHTQSDDGVMRMVELEDGITLAPGESHQLRPGADHVMLLGLTNPLEQGDTFDLLVFLDVWVPLVVTVTVDNAAVDALAAAGHGEMDTEMDTDADGDGHSDGDGEMDHDTDGHGSDR